MLQIAEDRKWGFGQMYDYTYVYNGAYWKQCSKSDMKMFLSDVAVKMGYPDYKVTHYEFAANLLKQFLSYAHITMPKALEGKVLINLQNHTFEFGPDGWRSKEFNPTDFMTYQLQFDYNKTATCPLFDKFLLKVLPDVSSRMVLQEFAGYIFTKLNHEKCLVLTGSGGNGKSVFFNILNALVGKNNTLNYSLGQFSHEYKRAKLTDVLLNYSSERGFDLNPDIFKTLVSGEPIQAREPHGKSFTIYNLVKFIINCNELPSIIEDTEAFFRRFLIIQFNVKITEEEKDIHLAEKIIKNELPSVFNWLLTGLERVMEHGFTQCESSEKALKDFRKQADSVQQFIEEQRYIISDKSKVTLSGLYDEYKNFCRDNKYRALGRNKFSQILERKGFEKIRRNDGTYFCMEKSVQNSDEVQK